MQVGKKSQELSFVPNPKLSHSLRASLTLPMSMLWIQRGRGYVGLACIRRQEGQVWGPWNSCGRATQIDLGGLSSSARGLGRKWGPDDRRTFPWPPADWGKGRVEQLPCHPGASLWLARISAGLVSPLQRRGGASVQWVVTTFWEK